MTLDAMSSSLLLDCGPAAHSFFGSLRVSAALVAAATIKEAFVLQKVPDDIKNSEGWTLLRHSYLMIMMLAFTSEVLCVFVCTFAIVVLQAANLDTRALSVIALLIRELEYEYVAARCHFVTGVFGFLIGQSFRLRLVLRHSPNLSKFAMLQLLHTACAMITYNNGRGDFHAVVYGGYVGVSKRFMLIHSRMLIDSCQAQQPLAIVAIVAFLFSAGFGLRMFFNLLCQKKIQSSQDKQLTIKYYLLSFFSTSYSLLVAAITSCVPFLSPRGRQSEKKESRRSTEKTATDNAENNGRTWSAYPPWLTGNGV